MGIWWEKGNTISNVGLWDLTGVHQPMQMLICFGNMTITCNSSGFSQCLSHGYPITLSEFFPSKMMGFTWIYWVPSWEFLVAICGEVYKNGILHQLAYESLLKGEVYSSPNMGIEWRVYIYICIHIKLSMYLYNSSFDHDTHGAWDIRCSGLCANATNCEFMMIASLPFLQNCGHFSIGLLLGLPH